MAIDISKLKVKPAEEIKRNAPTRTKRDLGPNHWANKDWDNSLWASYVNGEAYTAELPGKIEMLPAKRGDNKGQLIEKVTGEAGDAITLIREASNLLNIGAAIRWKPARNGFVAVTWQGQTRKKRKTTQTADTQNVEE